MAKSWPFPKTFSCPGCRTRRALDFAYLKWMQKTNHPDLAKSNYNADKFKELHTQTSRSN